MRLRRWSTGRYHIGVPIKRGRLKTLRVKTLSVFSCLLLLFATGEVTLQTYISNYLSQQARTPHALTSGAALQYTPAANQLPQRSSSSVPSGSLASQLALEKKQQLQGKPQNFKHVKLLAENRSATSREYLNADGSKSLVYTAAATSYQDANGSWQDINNTLVQGSDGVWRTKANQWIASFGNSTTYGVAITKGSNVFREIPEHANSVKPEVTKSGSDQIVTYKNLWDGVNLEYRVNGSEVKETITLTNSSVASNYSFAYSGADLTPLPKTNGAYNLGGAFQGMTIGAPTLSSRTVLVPYNGSTISQTVSGSTIRVSVDPNWLQSQPAAAFPIVIDPTVFTVPISNTYNNFSAGGLTCPAGPGCGNLIGHDATPGGDTWRSVYQVAVPTSAGQYLVSAKLHVEMPTGSGNYGVTTPTSITVDHAGCTTGFNCVDTSYGESSGTVGTSADIELAALYRNAVANNDSSPWMIIRGDESSSDTFKYFDNTKTTVTFTYETLPTQSTIGTGAPANGGVSVTNQPVLTSTVPTDPDGPGPFQYRYIIGTSQTPPTNDPFHIQQGVNGVIADSGLLNLPQWAAPPNVLQDGTTYYWQPIVWDSYSGAPQVYGPIYSFKVDERNGKDTTQTFDSLGPVSVDFATGNLMTSSSTNSMTALGGTIGLGLNYNTPQRSSTGLIGQYWNDPGGTRVFPSSAPALTRTDPNVAFDWNGASPDAGVVTSTNFLVRWSGYFVAPQTGTYEFGTTSDDGSRVYINGSVVADGWNNNPTNLYSSGIALTSGQVVPITYEYFQGGGNSFAHMLVKTTDNTISARDIPSNWLQTGIQPIATPHGLIGHYYTDDGTHTFPSNPSDPTRTFLTRTDTSLNLNWGYTSPVPNGPTTNYMVRWTGYFTAPVTDTYTFGAGADDGVRVILNGNNTVVDAWSDHVASPIIYATSGISLTQGQTIPITIEYYQHGGAAQMTLYAKQASLPSVPDTPVSSAWLTPQAQVLPDGWSTGIDATTNLNYSFAVINQGSVVLYDATGESHEYKFVNGGFTPPMNESGHMVRNGDGTVTLQDNDGQTYIFNTDGTIQSVTTAADDRNPAALQYAYGSTNGSPVHLTQITDAVNTSRWLKVYYGSDSNCPTPPSGFNPTAPATMICATATSDGSMTKFYYTNDANGIPRLARVEKPGSDLTDYGYDSAGRIVQIRDDVANDAVSAGVRNQDGTEVTQIGYDALGRVASYTVPAATAGATRQMHMFQYITPSSMTLLNVANATEPNGFTRKVTYDGTFRTITDTDIANLTTTTVWDPAKDLVLSSTDPSGLETTNLYDYGDRLTDTYGPAPATWFGTDRKPLTAPIDYTSQVPHQQTGYDQNIPGLAAAYYDVTTASNGTGSTTKVLFGNPKSHATGIGPANGDVVQTWNGTPPVTPDTGDGWGARLTGDINLTTSGAYTFRAYSNDGVRMWIDDQLVIDDWNDGVPRSHPTGQFNNVTANTWHRVRIDYYNSYGDTNATLQLYMTPPGGTETSSLGSLLTPMYGLKTTQNTYDANASVGNAVTVNSYGTHPELSLLQSSTVDPTGLNLTTSYTYESQGTAGSFLRQTSKTLPGGATTNYTYYGAADTRQNPCNTTQTYTQQGMLKITTDPTGVTTENVYDNTGRTVATRTGSNPWKCTTYDSRGRVSQVTIPALTNTPHVTRSARTINYNYAYAGNPLVTYTSDNEGAIKVMKDLLGRTTNYTETQIINNTNVIYGTSYTYDTIGRLTTKSGVETEAYGYDNFNRLSSVKYNGTLMASPSYDVYSRLQQVTYPNAGQQKLVMGRDSLGRVNSKTYTLGNGTTTIADAVTLSQSGQVVSGTENGAAKSYTYDKADRLTNAVLGSNAFAYSYAAPSPTTCSQSGANLNAPKDGNMTSATVNGATTTYCYDSADQLIASSNTSFSTPTYDAHANLSGSGAFTKIEYDSSDRAAYIADTGGMLTTTFDPLDRKVYNSTNGSYFGYTDTTSTPTFQHDSSGFTVSEYYLSLPGGVQETIPTSGAPATYSLSDIHGDFFATTDGSGGSLSTYQYDPFGNPLGMSGFNTPSNASGSIRNAWLGQFGVGMDTGLANKFIQMGARLYIPTLSRFAQTDPIEGGNANAYAYPTDPVNESDITGQCPGCVVLLLVMAAPYVEQGLQAAYDYYAYGGASVQGGDSEAIQGGLTKAEQIAQNAARGKAAEEEAYNSLVDRYGAGNVARHDTFHATPYGRRFPDISVYAPEGRFYVEVKSGKASYSALQQAKDAWIEQNLGIPTQLKRLP